MKLDNESIDLLIGQDCPVLLRQLEARYGKPDEPYAIRTVLGWTICGPIDGVEDDECSVYFISSASQLSVQEEDFSLRNFWEIEKIPEHKELSFTKKEQQILEHTERTTVKVNDRYQVNLPWRMSNNDQIPDSYDMALRRLESTERRLKKFPTLRERYTNAIEDYEKGRYIEKLDTKPDDIGWYLPHHLVILKEQNTKCCVVFDSAAKAHGTSLNDLLEKGPCLLNDLTGILLHFCRYKIGIAGDISKMFLRILLNPKDCRFHRFLWRTKEGWNPNILRKITEIRLSICHLGCETIELDHNVRLEPSSYYLGLSMASGFLCQRGFSPDTQRLSEWKSEQKNHYKADSLQNNSILLYTLKTFSAINEQKQH